MAPNQRLALLIMGSVLLVGVGRVWLVTSLSTKNNTADLATNIQGTNTEIAQDLEDTTPPDTEEKKESIIKTPVSGGNTTSPVGTEKHDSLGQLTILLPPWSSRIITQDLFQRLLSTPETRLHIIQPDTLQNYYNALGAMSRGSRQADVMLIPWQDISMIEDRAAKVDWSATTPPLGHFHPQVAPLITKQTTLFIPHGLDPRITLTNQSRKSGSLGNFLQTYRSPIGLSGTNLYDPLLVMLSALRLDQLYTAKNIKLVEKVFSSTSTRCTSIQCLTPTTALRVPLSMIPLDKRTTTILEPLPTLDNSLPTTVRGWVVRGNDETPLIQQRLQLMQQYLQFASEDTIPYDDILLSPIHNRLQRTLLQNEWSRIKGSIYELSVQSKSISFLQSLFETLPLSSLIDESYRPELYLERRHTLSTEKQ